MTSGLPIRICTQATQSGAGGDTWHVLLVVCHAPHVGLVAPWVHDEVRVCVIEPVCPCGQESVWVCDGSGVHDAGVDGIVFGGTDVGGLGFDGAAGVVGTSTGAVVP